MKRKKQKILGTAGSILLGIVLIAAWKNYGGKTEDAVTEYKTRKKTELKITYAKGDAAWNNAVSSAAEKFMEQYPDIRIVFDEDGGEIQSGIYGDYIKKMIATEELGDVVEVRDASFMEKTGLLTVLPEKITEAAECAAWSDGQIYVIPEPRGIQGIIYNRGLFETLGLSEPETYQEFLEICDRLKKYRVTPIVVGGKDSWHYGFWINHFFRTDILAQDEEWEQKCTAGETSWEDEKATRMLEHLKTLYENGYVNKEYRSVTDSETALWMAKGNTGMLYAGPWMVPKIKELNPDISLGWFFLPDENGNRYALMDQSSGWGITKACKETKEKYEAAQLFLKFMYTDEIQAEMCSITNTIPASDSQIDLSANPFLQEVQEKAGQNVVFSNRQIGDEWTPENFIWIMYSRIPDFFDGTITLEEFQQELDAAWKQTEAE